MPYTYRYDPSCRCFFQWEIDEVEAEEIRAAKRERRLGAASPVSDDPYIGIMMVRKDWYVAGETRRVEEIERLRTYEKLLLTEFWMLGYAPEDVMNGKVSLLIPTPDPTTYADQAIADAAADVVLRKVQDKERLEFMDALRAVPA